MTDAGLDQLKACENLEYLNLFNTADLRCRVRETPGLKGLDGFTPGNQGDQRRRGKTPCPNPDLIINLGWDQEIGRPAVKPVVVAGGSHHGAARSATESRSKDPEANFFSARIPRSSSEPARLSRNEEKKKGEFQAHTLELFVKGGEETGAGVVPGKPDESSVIKRLLFRRRRRSMPPKDKPQPTEKEIAMLKWWVASGCGRCPQGQGRQTARRTEVRPCLTPHQTICRSHCWEPQCAPVRRCRADPCGRPTAWKSPNRGRVTSARRPRDSMSPRREPSIIRRLSLGAARSGGWNDHQTSFEMQSFLRSRRLEGECYISRHGRSKSTTSTAGGTQMAQPPITARKWPRSRTRSLWTSPPCSST